jgi:hypothetical protein
MSSKVQLPQTRKARNALLVTLAAAVLPLASAAQQPTPQQQNAIRQSCRSDFQTSCAGVPTGGTEALQCLKRNFDSASPGCQKALGPLMGSAPAAAAASGGASTSAPPAGGTASATAPAKSAPAVAGAQGAATGTGQPASMREELMLTREVCGPEFRSYCANVQLGGGRAMQCLEANAAYLSPRCKGALAEIRARR